jgi:glycosyltransferase involved in cell wall biosynthesis
MSYACRSIGFAISEKYDVLFATTTPLTAGLPGIFARWLKGQVFVFEVRDLWPELPRAMGVIRNPAVLWFMSLLEFASYRSAHKLIGLSPGIVDGIARRGVPRKKIELVPNGASLEVFAQPSVPWRPAGAGEGDLLAVFTGTHGVANGLSSVLDAAKELKARGRTDIKLLLVGDGKQKAQLLERAAAEKLDCVLFHPPVEKSRLVGLMAAADVGMQILADVPAFYYGTSPNKFFDYLAAGKPVLINYPGWVADLVNREKCGVVVPPRDPVAFADALEGLARDRIGLVDMGLHARRLAEREFAWNLLAKRVVRILESVARA